MYCWTTKYKADIKLANHAVEINPNKEAYLKILRHLQHGKHMVVCLAGQSALPWWRILLDPSRLFRNNYPTQPCKAANRQKKSGTVSLKQVDSIKLVNKTTTLLHLLLTAQKKRARYQGIKVATCYRCLQCASHCDRRATLEELRREY